MALTHTLGELTTDVQGSLGVVSVPVEIKDGLGRVVLTGTATGRVNKDHPSFLALAAAQVKGEVLELLEQASAKVAVEAQSATLREDVDAAIAAEKAGA